MQNELRSLSTPNKLRLVEALIATGLKRIEVSSFVSPRWIPQLADAEKLISLLPKNAGVTFTALVPNMAGLERAKSCGLSNVAVFLSATEAHSKKNINKSVSEAVSTSREVAQHAMRAGMHVRCYLSTVWGDPYEGLTPLGKVIEVVKQLADIGFEQLSLGDTIGIGSPTQTRDIVAAVSEVVPLDRIALHLHDTRGTALANALVGLSMGITTFDTSIGGLGGCPYAPGAAGNLATEDLVFMLEGMGVSTGIDMARLVDAGELAQELIGRKLAGKYLQAALGEREKRKKAQAV